MKKIIFLTTLFFLSFFFTKNVFAATEFVSVVDTGNGTDTDYTSLSLWETGVQTDLTTAQVFGGTKSGSQMSDTIGTIYLCRSGVYQNHYGTLVHERQSGTQILIENIVGAATEQSGDIWYTNNTCNSADYFTISNAGDSAIAIAKCRATTGAADTTAVTINGWTTSATNYIKIWTDPSENYRHQGKWDEGKYRLEVGSTAITIQEEYTRIEGLQILLTKSASGIIYGINVNGSGATSEVRISNNIIKGVFSGTAASNGAILAYTTFVTKIYNNIIYDFSGGGGGHVGIFSRNDIKYIYNNTVYNCNTGISSYSSSNTVAKNNISYNNTDNYSGTFDASSMNNLSGPGADAQIPATNARNGYVVTFADEYNQDFHLDSSDTGARNQGIILYDSGDDANLYFTTDVDNNARLDSAGTWDIGADENIAKIYRSVGPSASSALASGGASNYGNLEVKTVYLSGSTTNIVDYVASFWRPLPDTVGVGDAIQYDKDNGGTIDSVAFITKRIDSSHFSVRTATGSAPNLTTVPDDTFGVYRSYQSLFKAESGDENDSLNDTIEAFESWADGKNIATGQEQWNIACYANSTTADTVAVTIDGWTTSADSFIKIYTPTRTDEVGTSQRHLGVWDTSKYYMEASGNNIGIITVDKLDLKIDGLQINNTYSDAGKESAILLSPNTSGGILNISNNILRGGRYTLRLETTTPSATVYAWNNIIYSGTVAGVLSNGANISTYLYSTITIGVDYGIRNLAGTLTTKDCYAKGTTAYEGTITKTTCASSDATGSPGLQNIAYTTANFINVTVVSENLHLVPGSALANVGTDLSNDSYIPFNTDIDSSCLRKDDKSRVTNGGDDLCYTRPRGTSWDIGADELITKIYRSVGPGEDEVLETGASNHLNISGSTATFDTALGDDVGVGDALEYDDDNDGDIDASDSIAFISGRTSSTVFTIKKADGSIPTAPSAADEIHWNINRAYTSLSNAEAGTENTLIDADLRNFDAGNRDIATNSEQWNIACYAHGTTADTTAVTIDGWTTAAQNYIKIYTPVSTSEVGTSQRHQGKWDGNKYNLVKTNNNILEIRASYTKVEGLQFFLNNSSGSSCRALWFYLATMGTARDNILKADGTSRSVGLQLEVASGIGYAYNNVIYGFDATSDSRGLVSWNGTFYGYNNTVINNYVGIYDNSTFIAKNNISYNNTTDYSGTFNSASTNNLSKDATAPAYGTYYRNITDLAFVDVTNYDFHLATTDTRARNLGADLSQDYNLPITNDIDGNPRPYSSALGQYMSAPWDIGADESATPIYRSIAPSNTSALATGAGNNLTISGTTATFASTVEGTNAVGVGDAIQYDSNDDGVIDAIAFISGRTSGTSFTVQDRAGTSPAPTTVADQDWSIFRAYTTLDNAEGGVENTGISSIVVDFDRDVGAGDGKDIYTANQQWNIAAYANGSTADTTAVTIDGWTTAPQNYIKIYTPYLTSEVGTSQRHNGKWDDGKYNLAKTLAGTVVLLKINEEYVRVEGLQLHITNSAYQWCAAMSTASVPSTTDNEIYINNNIIWGTTSGSYATYGFYDFDYHVYLKIWNNIVYGFSNSGDIGIGGNSTDRAGYIYNNTVYGCYRGIMGQSGGYFVAKNNISYNNSNADYYGILSSNSTNNLSKDATAPAYNTYYRSKTLNFVNTTSGSEDFHLTLSDTDAMDKGTDLSADANLPFSTDIDGETRGYDLSNWDIGADEWKSNNKTNVSGLGTVTINMSLTDKMTNGLVGMWSFDGPDINWSTNTAYDRSGSGNNGTISGATAIMGKKGQGLNFNGTSDYVDCGNIGSGIKTISFWIKTDDATTRKIINIDGTDQIEIDGSSNILATSFPGATIYVDGAVSSAIDTGWHFITITDTTGVNASTFQIGQVAASFFDGVLDEVRVYNRALSADEIGDLYRLGEVKYAR